MADCSEYQRDNNSSPELSCMWYERQKAGIEAAKARGVYTGRAVGSTKANPGRARELKKKGLSMDEIATALGVSARTVTRYLDSR